VVCGEPSVCCHVRGKRMWGDVGNCWPGCPKHHAEQHDHGIATFQLKYQLDLAQIAAGYAEGWAQRQNVQPAFCDQGGR